MSWWHIRQGNYHRRSRTSSARPPSLVKSVTRIAPARAQQCRLSYFHSISLRTPVAHRSKPLSWSNSAGECRGDERHRLFRVGAISYELDIDVLMQMHKQHQVKNTIVALQVSERAARSLLETLSESHADIRQGVDPALLTSERALRNDSMPRERQTRLLSGKHNEEQASDCKKRLIAHLEYASRGANTTVEPRYAAEQPVPLVLLC